MYKIAVIGDRDSVLGFMSLGISVFEVTSTAEATKTLRRIAKEQYAVIFITQNYAREMEEAIDGYRTAALPAVIPIPDRNGGGYGVSLMKSAVERAVGTDILFRD